MPYIIAGLGNPGEEYTDTRHNTGRIVLETIREAISATDYKSDKLSKALISKGEINIMSESGKSVKKTEKVTLVAPETFMNKSGYSVGKYVKTVKAAEKLIVIYDDFSIPLGRMKISWDRSSGGHNGLESVIRSVKTTAFIRLRIGIAPEKANGDAKVPHGDAVVEKFILSPFKPDEMKELKKVAKRAVEAVEKIVADGREPAMSVFNAA
jgi:peptidyl-tRNA hydrolase, PTH1 family